MEEIQRSPVEVSSLSHYLQGLIHLNWCRISSINSMYVKNAPHSLQGFLLHTGSLTASLPLETWWLEDI